MLIIDTADDLSTAWIRTVKEARAQGGKALHVVTTVSNPDVERSDVRDVVDQMLETHAAGKDYNSVETVASTIFPDDLYVPPDFDWSPQATLQEVDLLNTAAGELYEDYITALPIIQSGNTWGTYFQRMIDWNGYNQLARKIEYLRRQRCGAEGKGVRTANSADIALGMEGVTAGVQLHGPTDLLEIGNPCLVHVDLTVHARRLNLLATYRHWYLMGRAYGNLLGLSRLHQFLAQQSGYELGELVVISGMTNIESRWSAAELAALDEINESDEAT